jgi:hypothetical protein
MAGRREGGRVTRKPLNAYRIGSLTVQGLDESKALANWINASPERRDWFNAGNWSPLFQDFARATGTDNATAAVTLGEAIWNAPGFLGYATNPVRNREGLGQYLGNTRASNAELNPLQILTVRPGRADTPKSYERSGGDLPLSSYSPAPTNEVVTVPPPAPPPAPAPAPEPEPEPTLEDLLPKALQGYEGRFTSVMDLLTGIEEQGKKDIGRAYDNAYSRAASDLTARGLSTSSIMGDMGRGIADQSADALTRLVNSMAITKGNFQSQLSGDYLDAVERARFLGWSNAVDLINWANENATTDTSNVISDFLNFANMGLTGAQNIGAAQSGYQAAPIAPPNWFDMLGNMVGAWGNWFGDQQAKGEQESAASSAANNSWFGLGGLFG